MRIRPPCMYEYVPSCVEVTSRKTYAPCEACRDGVRFSIRGNVKLPKNKSSKNELINNVKYAS